MSRPLCTWTNWHLAIVAKEALEELVHRSPSDEGLQEALRIVTRFELEIASLTALANHLQEALEREEEGYDSQPAVDLGSYLRERRN
jgi:hypothetical protein